MSPLLSDNLLCILTELSLLILKLTKCFCFRLFYWSDKQDVCWCDLCCRTPWLAIFQTKWLIEKIISLSLFFLPEQSRAPCCSLSCTAQTVNSWSGNKQMTESRAETSTPTAEAETLKMKGRDSIFTGHIHILTSECSQRSLLLQLHMNVKNYIKCK